MSKALTFLIFIETSFAVEALFGERLELIIWTEVCDTGILIGGGATGA
jgi:hypothetical protein